MKPLSRSWSTVLTAAAFALTVAGPVPTLLADANHATAGGTAPNAHAGAGQGSNVKFNSTGEAWTVVQHALTRIQERTAARDLPAVHGFEETLSVGLKYLEANSPMVTGDRQKRLAPALKQALAIAENVHTASDAGDQAKTEAEVKKLQAALKLVAVQYPADALQAPAGFVKYVCPMEDFTGEKPGDCPVCGMKLKPSIAAFDRDSDHGGHAHGAAEPTMTAALTTAKPLVPGQEADVILTLKTKNGAPVTVDDLTEAHTEKIHVLIVDPSLTDYHHEHPVATAKPGEYAFSFTPKKAGPYRLWADVLPKVTNQQEYVVADIAGDAKAEPITDRTESLTTIVDGLTYTLSFKGALKAGEAVLGALTIKDASGKVFPSLEPIMGAYAHIVGFSEDYKTIAHIHPMGPEPTKPTDRGTGTLEFHLQPEQAGLLRLFAQVQIGGVSKFAPFTLHVQTAGTAVTSAAPH